MANVKDPGTRASMQIEMSRWLREEIDLCASEDDSNPTAWARLQLAALCRERAEQRARITMLQE